MTKDSKKIIPLLITLVVLIIPVIADAQSFPAFPMSFWGQVTINGNQAPAGTLIDAYYGSTLAGQVVVREAGIYGYTEPTKQKLVLKEGDGAITFKFQSSSLNGGVETAGTTSQTYSGFVSGETVEKNLAFTFTVATPTPEPPGGGGGGGAGAPPSTPTPTPTPGTSGKSGDANGDGRVDLLDFNALMIQWGRTGSSNSADLNNDGKVDIFDFNILMINWLK